MKTYVCLVTFLVSVAKVFGQSNVCSPNPCRNDGVCNVDLSVDNYRCVCREGTYGTNCEFGSFDLIVMEGSCPTIGEGTSSCSEECTDDSSCPELMKCCSNGCGRVCVAPERDADWCLSSPCTNGGTCVSDREVYTCFCPAGYFGKHCEQSQGDGNWCLSNPCGNGAISVFNPNGYACVCPGDGPCGLEGSTSSPPSTSSSPPSTSSPSADVTAPGDAGSSAGNHELLTTVIVIVACAVVGVALLVLIGIFLYRRRRRTAAPSPDTLSVDSEKHILRNQQRAPQTSPQGVDA